MKPFLSATLAALAPSACAATGPARNDDLFKRVQMGLTEPEVRALLGAPDDNMRYPLSGNTGWGWRYFDAWGTWTEFSVTFDAGGHAISTHSRRLDGGDKGK